MSFSTCAKETINTISENNWTENCRGSLEELNVFAGVRNINNHLLSYAGRPPWYDCKGNKKKAYIIGLCGGSASGKTTLAQKIIKSLCVPWVVIVSLDSFYKVLSLEDHLAANRNEYDFDSPNAIDFSLAIETIKKMKMGKKVEIPIYDFTTHSRIQNKSTIVYGASVIVVEGIMTFLPPELLELLDLKIFVDTDSDDRLSRRIRRDLLERGRDLGSILSQYSRYVKPNYDKYIAPLINLADLVVPWNDYNLPAIDIITRQIRTSLEERGFLLRSKLLTNFQLETSTLDNVHIIDQTNQVIILQTLIRNAKTTRPEFVKYSIRLMKMCIVHALSLLNYHERKITVIQNDSATIRLFRSEKKICAVPIMRAGEAFENALEDVLYDYCIGKLLIQTNKKTDEPEFHYSKLPLDIKNHYFLLFDPTIASGAAALMAVRILIDHDIAEEDIIFVTLFLTSIGSQALLSAFPKVKIVTAAIDPELTKNFYILPGVGNFGKRYFGI